MNHEPTKITADSSERASSVWNPIVDLFIRVSGWSLLILLIVAYATGEEFQHTHGIIGYGIAVLLVAVVFWELVRPRHARFSGTVYSLSGIRSLFQNAISAEQLDAGQTSIVGLVVIFPILAILAACAVIIMLVTHNFWGPTLVDEMHEVVAYFALGLLAFYVTMVVVASSGHVKYVLHAIAKGRNSSS